MKSTTKSEMYCLGCLCSAHEYNIQEYNIQYDHLKAMFEVSSLKLCYLCRRKAQNAELFIRKVQNNQILMKNCLGDISKTIQEIHSQLQPPVTLVHTPVESCELIGECSDNSLAGGLWKGTEIDEAPTLLTINKELLDQSKEVEGSVTDDLLNECENNITDNEKIIKMEFKEEEVLSDLKEGLGDDNDEDPFMKEEDDLPLNLLVKQEQVGHAVEVTSVPTLTKNNVMNCKQTKEKEKMIPPRSKKNQQKLLEYNKSKGIEAVNITDEQLAEERRQMSQHERYRRMPHKCEDCVVGFRLEDSLLRHRRRHDESRGAFQCDVCALRMTSARKLNKHRRYHYIRFKCVQCGLLRLSRQTIKEHQAARHAAGELYCCPHCSKTFRRRVSFRKHMQYSHERRARVECQYCHKSYAENALKPHMIKHHPSEVGAPPPPPPRPRLACPACPATFTFPSELNTHSYTHTHERPHYCVECDKSFKNEFSLKNHFRTSKLHVNYLDLPQCCGECGRRFALARDLERHRNRDHLRLRPHACDLCDKTYMSRWALQDHRRRAHGGYKDARRFPCQLCDKSFSASKILKAHMRTHTGERPHACALCGAAFSQSGSLHTHTRLVHLKLARKRRTPRDT